MPDGWTVEPEYGDVDRVEDGDPYFDDVDPVGADGTTELVYFVDAPEGPDGTGNYAFGPASAETDAQSQEFTGTDTNLVIGVNL